MRLLVSGIILFMILFLLAFSFKNGANESVSEFDRAGAVLTGAGESADMQTARQMQNEAVVRRSQEEGNTVLDMAIETAKESAKKWEESSLRLINAVWEDTKESAFLMASDVAELIYPAKPLQLKQKQHSMQAVSK